MKKMMPKNPKLMIRADEISSGEREVAEEAEPQHGTRAARLNGDERRQCDGGDREQGDDASRRPAVRVGLDERVCEGGQADDGEYLAGQIQTATLALSGLGHETPGDEHRDQADRHVDEEDALPAERVHHAAADDRAHGQGKTGDAGPHTDRLSPLARVREGVGEDRESARHHDRGADALHGARRDQDADTGRQGAGQ